MEMVYFTLAAIALYVISDWSVNMIERRRGERLENRSLLFFAIITVLSLASFSAVQHFTGGGTPMEVEATGSGESDNN
jgi:hypothetical protein